MTRALPTASWLCISTLVRLAGGLVGAHGWGASSGAAFFQSRTMCRYSSLCGVSVARSGMLPWCLSGLAMKGSLSFSPCRLPVLVKSKLKMCPVAYASAWCMFTAALGGATRAGDHGFLPSGWFFQKMYRSHCSRAKCPGVMSQPMPASISRRFGPCTSLEGADAGACLRRVFAASLSSSHPPASSASLGPRRDLADLLMELSFGSEAPDLGLGWGWDCVPIPRSEDAGAVRASRRACAPPSLPVWEP
mmetsp:Transcript_18794/g.35803  ORF Transcript_18794/g.35803 Transcript_18794/m.35803 type:complete len:248 (-) Transcript_18794:849-1592(-)